MEQPVPGMLLASRGLPGAKCRCRCRRSIHRMARASCRCLRWQAPRCRPAPRRCRPLTRCCASAAAAPAAHTSGAIPPPAPSTAWPRLAQRPRRAARPAMQFRYLRCAADIQDGLLPSEACIAHDYRDDRKLSKIDSAQISTQIMHKNSGRCRDQLCQVVLVPATSNWPSHVPHPRKTTLKWHGPSLPRADPPPCCLVQQRVSEGDCRRPMPALGGGACERSRRSDSRTKP